MQADDGANLRVGPFVVRQPLDDRIAFVTLAALVQRLSEFDVIAVAGGGLVDELDGKAR